MVQVNRKAARWHDAGMIDTFEAKSFLSPAECAGFRAGLRQAAGSQAAVLSRDPGGEVKPLVRRSGRQHAADPRRIAVPQGVRGDLPQRILAFARAGTTHEVLPVTHGERFTIVSWYW
jgi:predicted 2-oxoglutarate/Fe(II)-dependent dioxygenase YbiX